jgi:hypothetical protein
LHDNYRFHSDSFTKLTNFRPFHFEITVVLSKR